MQIPQDLIETAALKLKSVQSEAEFFQLRAQYLGKKSFVVTAFSKLRDLQSDEKVNAAKELNVLKNNLTKLFETSLEGIEGKGSASAPPALTEGTSTFGPMSRPWKAHEIDSFKDSFGYAPTVIPTAIDMLAVYVHKDNPTAGLSLQQLDAIFSKNRNGGMKKAIVTWGQLGLTGVWQDKPIRLYGRNSASGTYGFFKEHALFRGDFKSNVIEQPGSSSVVQSIANDRYGIGYSGIGYKTADVRSLPLSTTPDSKSITTDAENAYSGEYPLVHFLYLSVNHKPGSTLEPLRKEFLKYVLSATGQADVLKAGYLPVSYKTSQRSLGTITEREVK